MTIMIVALDSESPCNTAETLYNQAGVVWFKLRPRGMARVGFCGLKN